MILIRTLLPGLAAFLLAPLLAAQDTQEVILIGIHGDVHTYQLPAAWQAHIEEDHLLLGDGRRMRAEDIAAVRPRTRGTPAGHHEIELTFPAISGKRITQFFSLPDAYGTLADVPIENGFHRIDERTLVRAGRQQQ